MPFNEVEDIDFRKTCYFNNDHLELVDELNDDIDTYLMEAMANQQEIEGLNEKLKKLGQKNFELCQENSDIKHKLNCKEESIKTHKRVGGQRHQEIYQLKMKNKSMEQKINDLEMNLDSKVSAINILKHHLIKYEADYQDAYRQINLLREQNASLQKAHNILKTEHSKLKRSYNSYKGRQPQQQRFDRQNRYF
ncbi:hypothetical protein ACF0H5_003195 [Mactra antiquata]